MRVRFRGLPPEPWPPNEVFYIAPQQLFLSSAKDYEVFAVSVYDWITFVQLIDDLDTPTFFPRMLFDLVDTDLPKDWVCNVFSTGPVQLVLGPSFVAKDRASYTAMTEQRLEQLNEFWQRVEATRGGIGGLKKTLLEDNELPDGFTYPRPLRRLMERQLTRIEPWWVFDARLAREIMKGFRERYPGKVLVPFAKREDNDDVALLDKDQPGSVIVLHDFASDAWERRRVFEDFYAWLRQAVDDMIELDRLEEDQ